MTPYFLELAAPSRRKRWLEKRQKYIALQELLKYDYAPINYKLEYKPFWKNLKK